jgi:hypothetical protein
MHKALSVFAVALLIAAIGVVSAPRQDAQAAEYPGMRPQEETAQYPGADNITVYLECQYDGYVRLRLQWTTYNLGLQYEDLSLFNNGWLWGTFIGIGPFAPNQSTSVWEGLVPGQWHYLRINTLTSFGWQPSQTLQFLTRNDCAYYPPPIPQPPIPPAPPYPPTPPYPGPSVCTGTSTPQTYQAGNCPPPTECPATATILIFPPPSQGCVFTRVGTGGTMNQGQSFEVCYWVNQPMYVRIVHQGPNGQQTLVNGYDDGRGGCVWAPTPLGGAGQRSETLYGGPTSANQVLDTTTFNVP